MPITTTPSGGPQGEFSTYTPIYAQTLSATTASITFSNIPTTFTDLVLVVSPVAATGTTFPWMRFNGLSTSIYSDTHIYGISTGNGSSRRSAQSRGYIAEQVQAETTQISNIIVHIMNYSNTTTNKTYIARNNNAASSGTYVGTEAIVGLAQLTAPITSITIGIASGGTDYNLASGSSFTLYGIKAATPAPKATGGNVITTDGTYWYHAFKNSGLFDVKQSLTADLLVVAGGGGGGSRWGGGGGAGGLRCLASQSLTPIQYSVTIGAGGGGGAASAYIIGNSGTNSSFSTISTTGGGGGGTNSNGISGGSGGGGAGGGGGTSRAGGSGNAGGYTPVEGFAGGGTPGVAYQGGGGGGAGAIGSTAPAQQTGGAGGIGAGGASYTNYTIINTMAVATGTGVLSSGNYYYAGGGGGGGETGNGGAGGTGGGGRGGNQNEASGVAATTNTGGGGGGGANDASAGAAGGSGIVIVRYPV